MDTFNGAIFEYFALIASHYSATKSHGRSNSPTPNIRAAPKHTLIIWTNGDKIDYEEKIHLH